MAPRLALAGLLCLALPAAGQQSSADDGSGGVAGTSAVEQQIDAMRRELDRVQRDNAAMRGEIDQLRAVADDQWLTERRADEIRGLVQDVLADADTRASLQDGGMTAGWNEHFFLSSNDGRFLLMIEGLEQIRFIYNYHETPDKWRYGFENARTQVAFSGHVFDENIEYLVRGEFGRSGGNQTLLDGWVRYRFSDKLALRFGQFKLPFSREFLVGDGQQLAVERSLVEEFLSTKRSQGIELEYLDSVNRFSAAFADSGGGFFTGPSVNTPWSTQDTDWALTGRYERLIAGTWDQFADFTSPAGDEFGMLIGFAAHAQQGESTGVPVGLNVRDETRVVMFTGDVSMEWGGANLFASGYYTYLDSDIAGFRIAHFFGATVQAGVYIAPKTELFARAEVLLSHGNEFEAEDLLVGTLGVNYYIDGHDLKWTTDVSFGFNEVASTYSSDLAGFRGDPEGTRPQIVIRTQFQLMF